MKAILRAVISWRAHLASLGSCVAIFLATGALPAQDLVRVEEDWQLVLGEPDSNSCGPQIACTMSPLGNINGTYFTLELNHRSVPYWSPGGITLHHWNDELRIQSMERPDRSVMQTNEETVTWTQSLDVDGNNVTFQIKDGTSTTWGPFGYTGYLKLSSYWSTNNLNSYSPDVSVSRSGVAYASNRVRSLKILQVRGTFSNGTTATDNTVRVVHQLPNP
jgi:hypothetical protein